MPALRLRRLAGLVSLALVPAAGLAQTPAEPAVIGRWDLTVAGPDGPFPSWLEVSRSGRSTLVGRFVGQFGSARPVARIDLAGDSLRFAIPPQWEEGTGDLRVAGRLTGERLAGTLVEPNGRRLTFTGVRAPALRRAAAPVWGAPVALFNGRDLAGWRTVGGTSRWSVVGGVLTNAGGGANLVTDRTFGDFKLRVEFRYPAGSNSGIYLRGRHEVQIEDSPADPGPLGMGGVYGFLPANENAARAPGEWQLYEITLVGRRVTVVLNGRTVVGDQVIPGITGGAIDSDEGAPGPILIQGDHGPVEFRRIVLTPAR